MKTIQTAIVAFNADNGVYPFSFGNYKKTDVYQLFFQGLVYHPLIRHLYWTSRLHPINNPDYLLTMHHHVFISQLINKINKSDLSLDLKTQLLYFHTYLLDDLLVKTDRASMFNSLEVRVPFLDPNIVAYAFQSGQHHTDLFQTKKILRRLAADKLPVHIVNRKKQGFGIPLTQWSRGELKNLISSQINSPDLLNFFTKRDLNKIWEDHQSGTKDSSRELWMLTILSSWLSRWA